MAELREITHLHWLTLFQDAAARASIRGALESALIFTANTLGRASAPLSLKLL